jgi:hypothetical protein
MFYRTCPQAPIALVSGISAVCGIGTITDARVTTGSQIYLEVLAIDELPLTEEQFAALADYCETQLEDIRWSEAKVGDQKVFVLSITGTSFNFDHLFARAAGNTGDSEESWLAAEAIIEARRGL